MKKRILSVLLAFAMIFTLMPTALAALTTLYQVVTVDKTTVQAGEIVNVKVTLPNITEKAGSFTVNLKFDTTLFEVTEVKEPPKVNCTNKFGNADTVSMTVSDAAESNISGELTANATYALNTMEVAGVTVIDATLKAKASGVAAFSFTTFEITKSESSSTVWIVKDTDLETPPNVTIPKAPITSVTIAGLDAPAKGAAPDTNVTVTPAGLTADVNWFDDATQVTGNFAANTAYTVKIKLTASGGDNFAETVTAGDYTVTRNSDTELLLTKTFGATGFGNALGGSVTIDKTSPKFGETLNAVTTDLDYNGETAGTLSYQWYRGDTAIPSATGSSYTTVAADVGKTIKVEVKNSNNSSSVFSALTAAVAKADGPAKPTGLAVVSVTDTTITVTQNSAWEYSKDNGITWQDSNVFTGLTANTTYSQIVARVKATGTHEASTACAAISVTTAKASATITIADPGTIVYDGSAVEVGSGKDLNYTYNGDGAVTVKWYADNEGSKGSDLGTAPTNAGIYWIGVSAGAGTNYNAVTEVTHLFTITPKDISGVDITFGTQATYDGSSYDVVITSVKDGLLSLTKGTDYTLGAGKDATNVESKTLTINGTGNYQGSATSDTTWSLVPKEVTLTWENYSARTYGDGKTVTATVSNKISGDEVNVTVSGGDETEVGSHTATATGLTGAHSGNYKLPATAPTQAYEIGKATYSGTVKADFEVLYNDTAEKTVALSDFNLPDDIVDASFKGTAGTKTGNDIIYTYSNDKFALKSGLTEANNGNTASWTVTIQSDNYGDITATVNVKVIKKLLNTTTLAVSQDDFTYSEGTAAPVVSNKPATAGTVTFSYSGRPGTTYGPSDTAPTNAGKYTVKARCENATTIFTAEDDFEILAIDISSAAVDAITGLTYTGIAHTPTPAVKMNSTTLTNVTDYTLSYSDNTNAGTATMTVTGQGNYKGTKTVNFDIGQATPTYTVPTGLTAKYGQTLADVNIAATTGWSWMNTGTAVGTPVTKNFPAKFTPADAINYKTVENIDVPVAVGKADAPALTNITVSQRYTVDTEQSKNIGTAGMPADAGTLTYTAGSSSVTTGTATVSSFAVDNTGMVKYTITGGADGAVINLPVTIGSDNYENSTVNVVITLTAKDNQAALTLTGGTTVVYGQTLQLGTSGGSGTGAVTYAVTNGTGEATIDASGKLTPVKVGTVKVTATKAGDASYNSITSAEVEITITRATPTGAPKYTAITTSGKTLADAGLTLTGSTLNPNAGTLVWVDNAGNILPDTTAVAANTTYKWLFTPTDANYTTLTGSIELYAKSSGGGGGSYTPSYSITVDKTENGTITVSPKSASKGDTVTITVKPDKGYELEMLKALDKDGDALKLTEKNGKYTFKMPSGKVTVKGSFVEETPVQIFKDVPVDAYYYEAVKWAAEKGITGGVGNGLFAPNQPCTRAQIVTFLWRAAGSPAPKNMSSFADVPADAFYAKAVAWAVENGITGGTGDGKFSPDATCTRAQAVTFLYRASGAPAVSGNAAFSDVATNAYYAAAVKWAEKNGITGGIGGGLFGSDNDCTRAQIVTFLYRSVK